MSSSSSVADAAVIPPATLLLCHHGTAGAGAALNLALNLARPCVTTVVHLLVVPDLWAGMQGDDWLNNASTRDDFARYLESQLEADALRELSEVEARCKDRGLAYRAMLRVGNPAKCAIDAAREANATLAVVGPPRPKGVSGLRSRMDLERLVRELPCPLLIARSP